MAVAIIYLITIAMFWLGLAACIIAVPTAPIAAGIGIAVLGTITSCLITGFIFLVLRGFKVSSKASLEKSKNFWYNINVKNGKSRNE